MSARTRVVERAAKLVAEGAVPFGPRIHPCVCGAGRHAHKGANGTGACKDTACKRYRPNLAYQLAYEAIDREHETLGTSLRRASDIEYAEHRKANPRGPGEWSIGPSDVGDCKRRLWYKNLPPDDLVRAWTDTREAEAGKMLHNEITRRRKMIYPWRLFAFKVRIPGLDREYEIDEYDPITGKVVDYKTAGDYKWRRVGDYGPDHGVRGQLLSYGYALEALGYPVTGLIAMYYKRENGHDEVHYIDYSREAAEAVIDELLGYVQALDMLNEDGSDPDMVDMLFPRSPERLGPDDALCSRCPFRNHCWNVPAAESAGRGPYSYTVLGSDPEAEKIEETIGELVVAREGRLAAETVEKEVKLRLDGITPRRYGDYEGWEKRGALRDDTKGYIERIAFLYDMPEDQRPAFDEIEMPKRRDRSSIQWTRVRKATVDAEKRAAKEAAAAAEAAAAEAAAEAAAPPLRDDEEPGQSAGEVA